MKKLLLIVALLTISLTVCFGQAAVSGWGRGIFIPVVAADGDPQSGTVASWYHGGPRIGFTISGSSDNVGAHVDILFDGNAVGVGDQAKIWVKPVEMLTLSIGMIFDDTLRGNAGFCAYNWLRFDTMTGDDMVFERIGAKGMQAQFVASIAPVDGAYIVMGLGRTVPSWVSDTDVNLMKTSYVDWDAANFVEESMSKMFKQGQYAAGYDIPGIGLIRAQFIGYPSADPTDLDKLNGIINAAFKLTMVEGLMLDIGGKIPIDSEQAGYKTAEIDIYANYTMDTLVVHLAGDIHINQEEDGVNLGDLGFGVALGVEYGLDGGLTIQADARYRNSIALNVLDDEGDGLIGGGIFAKWSYSNGIFGLGLEVVNTNYTFNVLKEEADTMVIAIPIRLEYWF